MVLCLTDGPLLEGETGFLLMETGQRRTESELPLLCDGDGGYMELGCPIVQMWEQRGSQTP